MSDDRDFELGRELGNLERRVESLEQDNTTTQAKLDTLDVDSLSSSAAKMEKVYSALFLILVVSLCASLFGVTPITVLKFLQSLAIFA